MSSVDMDIIQPLLSAKLLPTGHKIWAFGSHVCDIFVLLLFFLMLPQVPLLLAKFHFHITCYSSLHYYILSLSHWHMTYRTDSKCEKTNAKGYTIAKLYFKHTHSKQNSLYSTEEKFGFNLFSTYLWQKQYMLLPNEELQCNYCYCS